MLLNQNIKDPNIILCNLFQPSPPKPCFRVWYCSGVTRVNDTLHIMCTQPYRFFPLSLTLSFPPLLSPMHSITILPRSRRVLHVIHHVPHNGFCPTRHGLFYARVIRCGGGTRCFLYLHGSFINTFHLVHVHALFLP